jgi:HAD superfamily hydrolase (TIGR01490 family)
LGLAIFDLDNTLIAGDSDYLWGCFLADHGIVDRDFYEKENARFYEEYKAGTLDIFEFLRFSLKPLAENDFSTLTALRDDFMCDVIEPLMLPKSRQLVDRHRNDGNTLLVISATNRFITEPIVHRLGIRNLLSTEAEFFNGRFTGKVSGTPCFQEGKVTRIEAWLQEHHQTLDESWFYSDSHNDLPLLEKVTYPVAVDPDATLAEEAERRHWPVISLR